MSETEFYGGSGNTNKVPGFDSPSRRWRYASPDMKGHSKKAVFVLGPKVKPACKGLPAPPLHLHGIRIHPFGIRVYPCPSVVKKWLGVEG